MDTLEAINNRKPFSESIKNTKALFDDNHEETFYRLLDILSVKAASWFHSQGQRPQLDETALSCLGMLVEEFMHHQLTPLIDIDHKARNIPLLTERLTKEELEAGTLPYLVKKYKKTHKIIEEGQVKPRPKISEDLAAFYKQEFKADERPPSTIIIKDEKKKKKKKKAIKHETHDIQEEHIKIKQEPLDTDSLFEEELQNTTQDRPVAIKLEETQPDIQLRPKHKSSKRRNQSTDFYDNLNRTKSRKKSAKKTKANKASMF